MERNTRNAKPPPVRRTERGIHIRSLLAGSGAKSAAAVSFLQRDDYSAAQAALKRHKSAAERGSKHSKDLTQAAKSSHNKMLCAEHRAVYRKERSRTDQIFAETQEAVDGLHLKLELASALTDTAVDQYCNDWKGFREMTSLSQLVMSSPAEAAELMCRLSQFDDEHTLVRRMLVGAARRVMGTHDALERHGNLITDMGAVGRQMLEENDMLRGEMASLRSTLAEVGEQLQHAADDLSHEIHAGYDDVIAKVDDKASGYLLLCCGEPDPLNASQQLAAMELVEQVESIDWPTDDMLSSSLQECDQLNKQLQSNIDALFQQYGHVFSPDTRTWACPSLDYFNRVVENYESLSKGRYTLLMDRLSRQFPSYSRKEIESQYHWCIAHRYFHRRLRSMVTDHASRREQLLACLEASCHDAMAELQESQAVEELRQVQMGVCKELNKKLKVMQKRRAEEVALQQAILEYELEEERRQVHLQAMAAQKRREADRAKLTAYNKGKQAERQSAHEENVKRLEKLQLAMAEQSKHDHQRIAFRQQALAQRQARQEEEKRRKGLLEEERERQLDKLRATVAVEAERDPLRLIQATEASLQHRVDTRPVDDSLPTQQPLYNVTSFTSEKVMSDPRMRVFESLQAQGLHQSNYASRIMASLPLSRPQRPDQKTTYRFSDKS